MYRCCSLALFSALLVLSAGSFGQDSKPKDDPKKTDPKKDDPAVKLKGRLPMHWPRLGLSDKQVQDIYKIQAKYGDEIAKLQAKIDELKATQLKEERALLTPEQKKRLEDILLEKTK
jgi:Spy/CpxP family protein refolding chaperone